MNKHSSEKSNSEEINESYHLSERDPLLGDQTSIQCSNRTSSTWTARKIIILALLSFVYFLTWCCVSLWTSFFPIEAEKRGVSSSEVGFIYGTYSLVAFIAALIYGPFLIPKIGPYFLLFSGLFLNGGTSIICGFIESIQEHRLFSIYCFLVRAVGALGGSACETSIVVVVADEFRDNISIAIGLLRVFTGLGFLIGPVLGGGLYSIGGFRLPLFVTGSCLLSALPFVWIFLPRKESHRDQPSSEGGLASLKKAFLIPSVAVISLWYLIGIISISFVEPTLQPYAQSLGVTPAGVGLLFLALSVSYLICTPIVGYVLDRKPLQRTFIVIGSFGMAICVTFFGPAPFLWSFVPRKVWVIVVSFIISGGAFSFGLVPVLPEMIKCCYAQGFPKDIATDSLVSGIYTGIANLGAFVGPVLGGVLTGSVGFPWTSGIMGICVALKAIALCIFFVCTRHKDENIKAKMSYSQSFESVNLSYRSAVALKIDR